MFNEKLQKAGYKIVQSDEQSAIFEVSKKFFAVCASHTGLTVYRVIKNEFDWQFLPTGKEGKSFRTVTNFVNARI